MDFTATSVNFCASGVDPFCNPGEPVFLSNGKMVIVGFQTIMKFEATDPRWDADSYFSADPFSPADHFPMMGSFVCYPTGPEYAGGWWEGSVRQVFMPDKFVGTWNGKGYGTLEGLNVIAYNTMSSHFNNLEPGITDCGTITELPGYQP